jgi:hypothetical protein
MILFKIRYRREGTHVHSRLFVGESWDKLANCGALVMREDEFTAFQSSVGMLHQAAWQFEEETQSRFKL